MAMMALILLVIFIVIMLLGVPVGFGFMDEIKAYEHAVLSER